MSRKIYCFGAGRRSYGFILENRHDVLGIFDNNKHGLICGIEIELPTYKSDIYVIVTVDSPDNYFIIREQLIGLGYKEFLDFIPWNLYKKRMALAYGNCHMYAIREYLTSSKEYSQKYGFYPIPMIQNMGELEYENIVAHADLIFHQSVREDNIFGIRFSSKQFLKSKKEECQVYSIPNLYGMPKCLFPQLREFTGDFHYNIFTDYNIIQWYNQGLHSEDITHRIRSCGVYEHSSIKKDWNKFIEKLCKREDEWDIKISDYILDNYKKKKLFYDPNHITSELAREIANRILDKMGFKRVNVYRSYLDDYEVFIYEDIKKALEMNFEDETIRNNTYMTSCPDIHPMDIDDYVELLIYEYKLNLCSN